MMEFPRYVFKNNGIHERAGGTYSTQVVLDAEEMAEKLGHGWYATLPEAINPPVKVNGAPKHVEAVADPRIEIEYIPEDNAPPTRQEIEAKCDELGITHNKRFSDATLLKKIEEKQGA